MQCPLEFLRGDYFFKEKFFIPFIDGIFLEGKSLYSGFRGLELARQGEQG